MKGNRKFKAKTGQKREKSSCRIKNPDGKRKVLSTRN